MKKSPRILGLTSVNDTPLAYLSGQTYGPGDLLRILASDLGEWSRERGIRSIALPLCRVILSIVASFIDRRLGAGDVVGRRRW